jgi:hypothetical protein
MKLKKHELKKKEKRKKEEANLNEYPKHELISQTCNL